MLGVAAVLGSACTPYGLPDPVPPSEESSPSARPPEPGTIVVGLDGPGAPVNGFNPYAIADWSAASAAVAELVLPSVFVVGRDGQVAVDTEVADAVAVTSTAPFTVTYTLDRKASWSDGTPITAEDFAYLRDQLLTQPATVDTAGYRLITAIRSRDAGKTVDVEFATSFPAWPSLFSPLLPSHILKDSPAGWAGALNTEIPVSGGRFRMNPYDPVTGQITLARNDKYWGAQPGPAAVVLRLGTPSDLIAAWSRGDVQALFLAPGADTDALLTAAVPADRRTTVAAPATVQLVFDTDPSVAGRPTADLAVRQAIVQAIGLEGVAADLGDGRAAGMLPVTSQVRLPSTTRSAEATDLVGDWSEPGVPVPTGDPAAARQRLGAAGWTTDGLYATRGGEVLTLTLGYPSGHRRLAAAARTLQSDLGAAGIQVVLLADAGPTLLETRVAGGTVDLALVTVPRGPNDAVAAATAFSCPRIAGAGSAAASATNEPLVDPALVVREGSTSGSADDTGTSPNPDVTGTPGPTTTPAPAAADTEPRTGNLSGFCAPDVQPVLATALAGGSVDDLDAPLWAALPVLPLAQPTRVFAVGPGLDGVLEGHTQGWTWSTPFVGAQVWPAG